ncbi:Uncharacterized protein HZ326_11323 [Fusarium oxysporum f. sp. albedinis]|nr:Uncharacterized protein HZ326_11323 [Fusarium oxysporum f. sp. albedinis]
MNEVISQEVACPIKIRWLRAKLLSCRSGEVSKFHSLGPRRAPFTTSRPTRPRLRTNNEGQSTDRHLAYIGIPRASVDSDMLVAALVSPGGSAHTPITDMPSITRTYLNPGDRV